MGFSQWREKIQTVDRKAAIAGDAVSVPVHVAGKIHHAIRMSKRRQYRRQGFRLQLPGGEEQMRRGDMGRAAAARHAVLESHVCQWRLFDAGDSKLALPDATLEIDRTAA